MSKRNAYFRLMRFHQPIGIFLLWAPTAWALWTATLKAPSIRLVWIFFCGTVVMRAAGCILNDIADRHFDQHVERTKRRPLTTGEVSLTEALALLFLLLLIAVGLVLLLPPMCFIEAMMAVVVTGIYPFSKRWIQTPQLILSLAFSMGIPMAYTAMGVALNLKMGLLFFINALWIVMYDTLYAMIDREDDLRIGVKSTAIFFASYDRLIIFFLQILIQGLWLLFAHMIDVSGQFYLFWSVGLGVMGYQQYLLLKKDKDHYFRAFLSNGVYGLVMWLALI